MNTSTEPKPSRYRILLIYCSAVLLLVISVCLWIQPDWLAPVSIVPAWCWLLPGVILVCLGYNRKYKTTFSIVLFLWILFTAIFIEEARSILFSRSTPTSQWKNAQENGLGIRVLSLNCAGNARAAEEVTKWNPDIVLLQESPSRENVEQLAYKLFKENGCFLFGTDTSLIVNGTIGSSRNDPASHFTYAEVELQSGKKVNVISLRLSPPVFRLDFWKPGFWIDHREKRIEHRQQIAEIISYLKTTSQETPVIIGGDFNSPPNDAALTAMRPQFRDAFSKAGNGWGATGTNDYPLFRVDQIWISQNFQATSLTAHNTLHSNHRFVIADLILTQE